MPYDNFEHLKRLDTMLAIWLSSTEKRQTRLYFWYPGRATIVSFSLICFMYKMTK